ncbi:1275_t:CDS:2, partial [Acaulospora morrowiae]
RSEINQHCILPSFGMLLWEIAELNMPYYDIESDIVAIRDRAQNEENRAQFSDQANVPLKYQELTPVQTNPKDRPNFTDLFISLEKLYEHYTNSISSEGSSNINFNISRPLVEDSEEGDISNVKTVEDALKEHMSEHGNKKLAWKLFQEHADNGNMIAKYWVGFYLYHNYPTPMDQILETESMRNDRYTRAAQLFKEVADSLCPQNRAAQFQYGNCLYNGDGVAKDRKLAFKYYLKAADNGNTFAMFKVANYYNKGKYIPQDKELSLKYSVEAERKAHAYAYPKPTFQTEQSEN